MLLHLQEQHQAPFSRLLEPLPKVGFSHPLAQDAVETKLASNIKDAFSFSKSYVSASLSPDITAFSFLGQVMEVIYCKLRSLLSGLKPPFFLFLC